MTNKQPNVIPQRTRKRETKSRFSEKKDIIHCKVEINYIDTRKTKNIYLQKTTLDPNIS